MLASRCPAGSVALDDSVSLIALCRLLSLADSALPVGGLAHSWGLEASVQEGWVSEDHLAPYLDAWCAESLQAELCFAAAAHRLASAAAKRLDAWDELNALVSAFKTNREGRIASLRLGGRLLQLLGRVGLGFPMIQGEGATDHEAQPLELPDHGHYATVFGFAASLMAVPPVSALIGLANQSLTGLVSAAQRLLPIGQLAAARLVWDLKPRLVSLAVEAGAGEIDLIQSFAPHLDIAAMKHPYTPVRLFLS